MKRLYRILRSLLVTLAILVVALPALLWVVASIPAVHNAARREACKLATEALGARVEIDRLVYRPFNEVLLRGVRIYEPADTSKVCLDVDRLGAGVSVMQTIKKRRLVVSYIELIELNARLSKPSPSEPLNIQPIIDKLAKKDQDKKSEPLELAIDNIVVRRGSVSYDVESEPRHEIIAGIDPNHLAVRDIKADVRIPRVGGDDVSVIIRRLALDGPGSLAINNLQCSVDVTPRGVALKGFELDMPGPNRLKFNDIEIACNPKAVKSISDVANLPFSIALLPQSAVTLTGSGATAYISFDVDGPLSSPRVNTLVIKAVAEGSGSDAAALAEASLSADVTAFNPENPLKELKLKQLKLDAKANMPALASVINNYTKRPVPDMAIALGNVTANINATDIDLDAATGALTAAVESALGNVDLKATSMPDHTIKANLSSTPLNLTLIPGSAGEQMRRYLQTASLQADINASLFNGELTAADADITVVDIFLANGNPLQPLQLTAKGERTAAKTDIFNISVNATCDDPSADFNLSATSLLASGQSRNSVEPTLDLALDIANFYPEALLPEVHTDSLAVSGRINIAASGRDVDTFTLDASFADLFARASGGRHLQLDESYLNISYDPADEMRRLSFVSDAGEIEAEGRFRVANLVPAVRHIIHAWQPDIFPEVENADLAALGDTQLNVAVSIVPENPLEQFFKLPVAFLAPADIRASVDATALTITASVDAPYLAQGNKLIEQTRLDAAISGIDEGVTSLTFNTIFPAKGGRVSLEAKAGGERGNEEVGLNWSNESRINRGNVALSIASRPSTFDPSRREADINIARGEIVFNDTDWTINPSTISLAKDMVALRTPLQLARDNQSIVISGGADKSRPEEAVTVELKNVNLDYVFNTLAIEVAMFGGRATGLVTARNLLGEKPDVFTNYLRVNDLTYNGCLMGDGDLSSTFDFATTAVSIGAVIHQRNGRVSNIDGKITPKGELLDFKFDCDRAPVGFLRPFMAAFCNSVSGMASGQVHLYGTFADVDMTGDVLAEDLYMGIDITGTTYHTRSDSVIIRPGRIDFSGVELFDEYNNSGRLTGTLTHDFFHDPCFNFRVDRARNLLCYDMQRSDEHPWYGRVFADGSVSIDGRPGFVGISANVAAVRGTKFYFELSDMENAAEHSFITFHDRTPVAPADTLQPVAGLSQQQMTETLRLALMRRAEKNVQPDVPSLYEMTFSVDVTPAAELVLVMDPAGGDRIVANGSGNMRLSYNSLDDDLRMYGTYTLERGSYTFTLQDIFIKDFTIDEGSSITFNGDPYSALLDIKAHYALTANLTDLDESFANDRDLTRTSVPVHAMLLITGDMRNPDLQFDIEFPTLHSDVYRKVKSIVSTEDMMNRQILYLLALNRFYTPEYMSATRGNELVSVASSTMTSRLSSMLGQLSDKITVAPAIRSDRGDFSDVEFDLALSSRLLNNRLLLNGTFGYRDPNMNSSAFIGDFDVEYLLNRSGSIRLKAYNRYNDQNYYLKSALTTQGVGVMFKRDFDNMFGFMRPWFRRKQKPAEPAPADSIPAHGQE